jgi:hypothetical protein
MTQKSFATSGPERQSANFASRVLKRLFYQLFTKHAKLHKMGLERIGEKKPLNLK